MSLRSDAHKIINAALQAAMPDAAVKKALKTFEAPMGKLLLIAVGKASWQMAKTASEILGDRINYGIVITKYGHNKGDLCPIEVYEAGHPIPDENSFRATERVIRAVKDLDEKDTVIFLLSGGGSALFEKPLVDGKTLEKITKELLACGADIVEINTVRKRLSAVKGGRFAQICAPAKVFSVVLSDIISDPLDMIASGPAYPDTSTGEQAFAIAHKYHLTL
ncbi:MAG TPA: glycerate kinase, partial [Clostridiales bacterium]|nr:glycerate kinase [Clostridiales bacterium]